MRTRLKPFIETLAIAVVYFLTARLGLSFAVEVPQVSTVWPPSGVALAALILFGIRCWPGIAVAAFLTNILYPVPVSAALGIAAGNTLEAVAGAYILRRVGLSRSLERVRDVAVLVFLAAIPCSAVAAGTGTTILRMAGVFPGHLHPTVFLRWWLGDAAGIWSLTPVLLAWTARPPGPERRRVEAAGALMLVGLLSYFIIVDLQTLKFLIFPLLAWCAVRLGQRRTSAACFIVTAIAIWGAKLGSAAFVHPGENLEESLGHLVLFSGATTVTSLLLCATVAERQRFADELHLKSEQLAMALEAGHVGIWDWDIRTGAIKWSENLIAIHCIRPEDSPCTIPQYLATIHPVDRDSVEESIKTAFQEGKHFRTEYRSLRPDGTMAWYAARGALIRDIYGSPHSMIGVCADVTERKRAEEELRRTSAELERLVAERTLALRDSEQRLRLMVEQIPAIIYMVDKTLISTSVMGAGLQLAGITSDELVGHTVAEVMGPEAAGPVLEVMRLALDGKHGSFESEWRGRIYQNHIRPLRNGNGDVVGLIGVAFDVTERKQAEARLAEEARRKDQFLAVLAHELRNPLAPIRNAVELLQRPGHTEAHTARACEIISRQVKHMVHLVDDLLDVARISHGKILLRKEPVDLVALLISVADEHRADIAAHGLQIEPDLPPSPVWVDGDATRITQVFDNLLHNAVKFTPPGGRVTVKALILEAEHAAWISVRDTGIGMEPGTLKNLFEPFAQADQSLDRSAGGLGLGLALSRQLLALHGARIEAFSSGIGQGSDFQIWFPLRQAAPVRREAWLPQNRARAGLKIEIIEDNTDAADAMRLLLESLGHTVKVVYDARSGLDLVRTFKPDFVLCDIGLPQGMNGYEFAAQFRNDPSLPPAYLIALTGYGQDKDVRRALEAGFNAHLTKPVSLDDLDHVLRGEYRPTFSP